MNVKNRTIFCHDNLEVLQGINSECIDLIYLDPPFNKKKIFTAPVGSSAEGASFKDWFREEDVKNEWLESIKQDYDGLYKFLVNVKELSNIVAEKKNNHYLYNYCYLVYMAMRLLEMRRILKDTGSIYLHCDNTMGHYIKILMDIIFGEQNFRNSIVWRIGWVSGYKTAKLGFIRNHDLIYYYVKSKNYIFNKEYIPYQENYLRRDGSKPKGKGIPIEDTWNCNTGDILDSIMIKSFSKEKTGYPTQKPVPLLQRIIKASSNEGDLVLDPFCGCATTCVAAELLGRKWIGVDVSHKAHELVRKRLNKIIHNEDKTKKQISFDFNPEVDIPFTTEPPKRTDEGVDDSLKKYVYVISNPAFKGYYKVGIASNVKSRLNSYQTGDPERNYKIEFEILTPYFNEIEKAAHKKFNYALEWVNGDLQEIKDFIENFKLKIKK